MSATIIPSFNYKDGDAAIKFLCKAFGFVEQACFKAQDGRVMHAELKLGDAYVMIGTVYEGSPLQPHQVLPETTGGKSTSTTYVCVDDVDGHCEKAKAAGAMVVMEPHSQPQGRYYYCKDPEGFLWAFGDYHPTKVPKAA